MESTETTQLATQKKKLVFPGNVAKIVLIGLGISFLILVFSMPYIWMVVSAFKPRVEIFANVYPLTWRTFIPINPTLDNFNILFTQHAFLRPMLNSIGLAISGVVISLAINSMIAFVLAWIEFPLRNFLFIAILATMLIAFEAKIVPLYLIIQHLNLYDTYLGMLVPWITDAYFIFLLRQHFKELSKELFEAAVLDGASYFRIYWNIMLPNIKPGLISAAFIKFIFTWDSYIWPLVAVRDEGKMVVTVALAKLFADEYILWELVFAGSFVATIPILFVFLALQRYYVQGFLSSGLKG